ncbi:tetratricopeptide repeat protein [Marinicella sp. W31]|uniref:protein kinase domain-containing protein n=1 Tax=Marinicella sp. W31 TaxID=3023713 RepID=UPI003757D356
MKTPEETWNHLIEKLTNGETIDWDAELGRYPQDSDFIEQLKSLEKIYSAHHSIAGTQQQSVDSNNQQYLFSWGHLQVIEPIGSGNFGEVFRAFDSLLNRDVALKLLKAEQMSATQSRHFVAEVRSLAKVRNAHVLAIHGASVDDGRVGFWADLLSGDTLADTTVDYSSEDQLLAVTEAITDALAAVHQAGLIHGDVKLSNVMRQDDEKITLMDFGAGGEIDMTSSLTGSPLLMAPELFDDQPKSAASDVYSLGVMLFKLATGEYPVKAKNLLEVMQAHKNRDYVSLKELRPDLDRQVRVMIDQMLSTEPADRPDTQAIKATVQYIKETPQRRNKRLALWSIFTLLVMGTLFSSWGFYQANQAREVAETEQQKAIAVSDFLAKILQSARPNISGKNTPVIEVLESASEELETALLNQPLARAQVLHHIGVSYLRMIAPKQAVGLLEEAFALRTEHLGVDHPETLSTQSVLGVSLVRLSRFEEAKPLLLLGDDVIDQLPLENGLRLSFTSSIMHYYDLIGELSDSERYARKALSLIDAEKEPVMFHDRRLQMAIQFNKQQRFDESEPIVRESLAWAENHMPRSGLTMGLRQQLSSLLGQTGRFEESEALVRVNIDLATEWLGSRDPYLIQSYTLLSNILGAQSRYEEALEVNSKALELSTEINGENDWYTIRLMGNQANRYKYLGQIEAAESMYIETIERGDVALSPKHQLTYLPRKNLAELYLEQGQYEAGIEIAEMTLPVIEEARGGKHGWLLELRYIYGALLMGKGDKVAGEKELRETLVLSKEVAGDGHPLTVAIIEALEQD